MLRYNGPNKNDSKHYDIQVKSFRQKNTSYVFIPESKFYGINFYVALVCFTDENIPNIYLIPASTWKIETPLFKFRAKYKNPEYGLNVSKKNMHLLDPYKFDIRIKELK